MASSQLSVQLYTVREALAADLTGTLERLAEIGFRLVEPFDFTAFGPALGAGLAAANLMAPTTHAHILGHDPEPVFSAAARLGIRTVIEPYVAPDRWSSAPGVRAIAEELDAAAKIAARHGIVVGYHNHSHELENVFDGIAALELLAAELDDDVVLEVDTYWAAVGKVDPVALLQRLGDRVTALHIKDGPGTKETKDQVAVGSGTLPIRDIIQAAPDALRVIELDDCRGDRFQAVADSFRFLAREARA